MDINITLKIDVTPGTMTDEADIKADILSNLDGAALESGFAYGPVEYTVNSVTPGS